MAYKNKIQFNILVDPDDPSCIILSPVNQEEFQGGNKYIVNIKGLQLEDGSVYSNKEEFYAPPTENFFCPVEDVKELIHGLNLGDENIIRHIIDASKTAIFWSKHKVTNISEIPDFNNVNMQEDYYPFYMFVKLHATVDSLKEFYISAIANPKKWKDVLSDLSREEEMDFDAIRDLISAFEKEADEWLELVVTITADPKWALRGKYSYAVYNTYTNPFHRIHWGNPPHNSSYNRGY